MSGNFLLTLMFSSLGSGFTPEGSGWEQPPVSRPWGFSHPGPLVRESLHLRFGKLIFMYPVYVLKSNTANFHYIGYSGDVRTRLKAHNAGKVRSTKASRPFTLIYAEEYQTKSDAAQRESFLKTSQGNVWLRQKLHAAGKWWNRTIPFR